MDIDIERLRDQRFDVEAGLLTRFPQRNRKRVRFSVAVAARLHPDVELAMVQKECRVAFRAYYPGAAGHVAGYAAAFEAIRMALNKFRHPYDDRLFQLMAIGIAAQRFE
jgi:hypothetical protein